MPTKEYMKEWRYQRFLKGICLDCEKPSEQFRRCIEHRIKIKQIRRKKQNDERTRKTSTKN